jgi:hypothetical protein
LNAVPHVTTQANTTNPSQWRQLPASEPQRRPSLQYV